MTVDFKKYADGLAPAVVTDAIDGKVLMAGFMNADAVDATVTSGRITFFSRSKKRLWTKGETSGNYLELVDIKTDCDTDTILITAIPAGPVCHEGTLTCFGDPNGFGSLGELERVIEDRKSSNDTDSYVASLFSKGLNGIAQKVGEEAVETIIAAKDEDLRAFKNEAADLLFHYLILLSSKGVELRDIAEVLADRRKN